MCRWLAYSGAPVLLEDVLLRTDHSLIDQSLRATDTHTTTNGDGFGVGWYGKRDVPGVYRELRPAWNDSNLKALAAQIESPMFLAHVRAATGSAVQRTNCHPFRHEKWLFVHNGVINEFGTLHRDLAMAVAPDLFHEISGSTDSEVMFMLALTFGMKGDVHAGIARMAGFVEHVAAQHGVEDALQMTLGISDGESLFAVRYSTVGDSRTLYHSRSREATSDIAEGDVHFARGARAVVSEPLTGLEEDWVPVPESSYLRITGRDISCETFRPIVP